MGEEKVKGEKKFDFSEHNIVDKNGPYFPNLPHT